MQLEDPANEAVASYFGGRSPAKVADMEYSQAVEWFGLVLEGYVPEEMLDAEIERAFRSALALWRLAEPERIAKQAEAQRRDQEQLAERQRYWDEHPEERPPLMFVSEWASDHDGRQP